MLAILCNDDDNDRRFLSFSIQPTRRLAASTQGRFVSVFLYIFIRGHFSASHNSTTNLMAKFMPHHTTFKDVVCCGVISSNSPTDLVWVWRNFKKHANISHEFPFLSRVKCLSGCIFNMWALSSSFLYIEICMYRSEYSFLPYPTKQQRNYFRFFHSTWFSVRARCLRNWRPVRMLDVHTWECV